MESQNIQKDIHTATQGSIVKKNNGMMMIISSFILCAGVASIYACYQQPDTKSSLSMFLLMVGILLTIAGISLFFMKYRQWVYVSTGSRVKVDHRLFDKSQSERLKTLLSKGEFAGGQPVSFVNNSTARLDFVMSEDNQYAAVQLFDFVAFVYEPITPVYSYTGQQASGIIEYIQRCEKG